MKGSFHNRQSQSLAVVVLVGRSENRRLLGEYLQTDYTVRTDIPEDPDSIGCILVDGLGMRDFGTEIETVRERSDPAHLPVMLVTRDSNRIPEDIWEVTDEIAEVPINKAILRNRVELLLRSRRQSLTVKRDAERSERRFRHLFDSTPDPILIVDDSGTIVDANDAFVNVVDRSHTEVVGENVLNIGFEPTDTIERILLRVADDSKPRERTVNYVNSSGETHISELNADVLAHVGNSTDRIGVFRDVTQRTESRRGLEQKIKRLDDFSSIVTHDLRNPLTIAMGKLQLAEEKCDVPEVGEALEALDRMEELIQNLLDFARTGTIVTNPSAVNIASVCRDSFELIKEAGNATLEVTASSSIYGDEEQMRRIFDNLFRNAIEHGGPSVTIRVGETDDGFFVEDDGPGISKIERDAVFSAGYTSDDGSSGLGLSIVHDIADAHGWDVAIETGTDGGARFTFTNVDFTRSNA